MSSSGIIALLMLGILATSIIPTEARQRALRKRSFRANSRRQDLVAPDEEEIVVPRVPVTRTLARKLSDLMSGAVADAVMQVIEDEPGRVTACDTLLRRRSNANFNQNFNQNIIGAKRRQSDVAEDDPASIPTDSEEGAVEPEEAEEEVADPPQRRRSNGRNNRRRRQNGNINGNVNDNRNVVYVRRTDPAIKNETSGEE